MPTKVTADQETPLLFYASLAFRLLVIPVHLTHSFLIMSILKEEKELAAKEKKEKEALAKEELRVKKEAEKQAASEAKKAAIAAKQVLDSNFPSARFLIYIRHISSS